ncbi:MAG TPA: PIN domain-containing protein, partial [Fimbriiglobus sp.]|nr:PIN domain-containing protein [Fimbriiglobus sp.]
FFIPTDPDHRAAYDWMAANRTPLITTDYAIDETLTLMRARRQHRKAVDFGSDVFGGSLADVHYLTPADIAVAWDVFRQFADKDWSFTDCTSYVVIARLGLSAAFSFDQHFRQFGTVAVVP